MTYELAKQLKDAGFPQNESDYSFRDCSKYGRSIEVQFNDEATGDFLCSCPTLSELIEACGDKFFWLKYHERDGWSAESNIFNGFDTLTKGGYKTPEEAVSNLWLTLNSK